jgi:hypothetical protein
LCPSAIYLSLIDELLPVGLVALRKHPTAKQQSELEYRSLLRLIKQVDVLPVLGDAQQTKILRITIEAYLYREDDKHTSIHRHDEFPRSPNFPQPQLEGTQPKSSFHSTSHYRNQHGQSSTCYTRSRHSDRHSSVWDESRKDSAEGTITVPVGILQVRPHLFRVTTCLDELIDFLNYTAV